ncbi:uncharacterized protein si:dkeyp-118a3.2 isoform X2 [Acipenser ruthenus]|uniref:uncharacterized protein si:dkeyp-118a3.2 isoform X2 n=1 Tax=Acipenser ruthenus TaxID=7906 RepID=UPI0027409B2B|nr:uncharacterized protein si:dkeyp-118a3.2 isoform X2 [Acipenser ruthenus]
MEFTLLKGSTVIILFALCKAQENVSAEVSASMESNLTTLIPTLERSNSTESTSLTTESHLLTRVAENETPQPAPEILNSHEESNIMGREISEESNYFNEIITPEDELLNPYDGTAAPTLDNFVDEVQATASVPPVSHKDANNSVSLENPTDTTEKIVLGIEAWKIGVISAAVFLFLETIVIIVYYRKCKKRRIRRTTAVKVCEDSEAAETIHGESNENTLTGIDMPLNQLTVNNTVEMSESKGNQELELNTEIPLDSPSLDINHHGMSNSVKTVAL